MKVGEVPYSSLKVGDRVISCTGKHGTIGQLVDQDPWGNRFDDWGGGILFLWNHGPDRSYSYSGWSDSQVIYLGDDPYPDPCHPLCNVDFRKRTKDIQTFNLKHNNPELRDHLSSKVSLDDSFNRPPPIPMDKFKTWIDSLSIGEWSWTRNGDCKYVTIGIDTRSGVYSIRDRDGISISFDRLTYQYSKETPAPPT